MGGTLESRGGTHFAFEAPVEGFSANGRVDDVGGSVAVVEDDDVSSIV
jgi:hypothetical protein